MCSEKKQRLVELTYDDLLRHIKAFSTDHSENLTTYDGGKMQNPSSHDIIKAINSAKKGEHVIFDKGANGYTYMQARFGSFGMWIMEYQDGNLDKHYKATGALDVEEASALLIAYAEGQEAWRGMTEWGAMNIDS